MRFTDTFIRRPLLAWVLNCLILLFGIVAFTYLDLRPYPRVDVAQVTIRTVYPGASADVVQGFVTGPLQRAVLGAEGIDYFSSNTRDGMSLITLFIAQGHQVDAVMTEVVSRVASVRSQLPANAEEPAIAKTGGTIAPLWVFMSDPTMSPEQLTEYFYRVVRPNLITVEGAAGLDVVGERPFAMRLWLDPVRMAAFDVMASDIDAAIRANNFISEAGEVEGGWVVQPVRALTDISNPGDFGAIVIRQEDGAVVRLRDVASVELASEPLRARTFWHGDPALAIGVDMAPTSNPLVLSRAVHRAVADMQRQIPASMKLEVDYDLGEFVERALSEVTRTLFEALAIVAFITLLFFGNPRSVMIMLISIPLSLVGTFLLMWMLGYSLNMFTLLALVIAIGLVVDDTIVVVENIHRYIEEGLAPMQAAITGAREVASPVIAMSLTLVAVYLPVGFIAGLTGDLIREFVFTLAGSVVISGIVALTLSPMLSSRILKRDASHSIAHWLDSRFDALRRRYAASLRVVLRQRGVWLMMALAVTASIPALLHLTDQELVPLEDIGYLHVAYSHPRQMNSEYVTEYSELIEGVLWEFPETYGTVRFEMTMDDGSSVAAIRMTSWDDRERTIMDLRPELQQRLNSLPGFLSSVFIFDLSPGPGGSMPPIQFVIKTTDDYPALMEVANRVLAEARASGLFLFAASNLTIEQPEVVVDIHRDKAGELGISMADVGTTLSAMLGDGHINRFAIAGESYKVIPRAVSEQRFDRSWLERYYVRGKGGEAIPLSAVVSTRLEARPVSLSQFGGLNSATLSMVLAPGVSMQQALDFLHARADALLPQGYSYDHDGQSRTFLSEGNTLFIAFLLAILTIYLFLVAQYESLRDPIVVLVTVPMSICGALIFLVLDFATLSLFSQVGLITLIGLISKHGILIVDFARRLQERGVAFEEALIEASAIRLRPILMTTAAIVMAVLPLIFATGPGAVSRNHMGLVIATGMTIGTLFTLFVLPVIYSYIAERREGSEASLSESG